MARRNKPDEPADEPLLFDLPLGGRDGLPADTPLERKRSVRGDRAPAEPVAPQQPAPVRRARPLPVPDPLPAPEPGAASESAGRGRRLAAGMADLVVHAAAAVAALAGARWLGVRPDLADWPALAVFLLAFCFLYTVLPLAFWGHTLGMAWAGITARSRDGEPLSFDQTARRWLGGLLTALLLGVPLLVTGSRRSLTDVISGSATYEVEV
jgi:uncharacterized RDD family membrane protein YckC